MAQGSGHEAGNGRFAVEGQLDDLLAVQGQVDGLTDQGVVKGLALDVHEQAGVVAALIGNDLDVVALDQVQHGGVGHDQVHGAGAQGGQTGGGIGHDIEFDRVKGGLARFVKVIRVGVHDHVVVGHPLAQGVGAGAGVRAQQAAFVGFHDFLGHDGAVRGGEVGQEGGVDLLQGDLDGQVVDHFHGLDVPDVAGGVAQGAGGRIQNALKGIFDVFRGHLAAVMEGDVVRQVENVGLVVRLFPAGGQLGDDVQVLVHVHQGVVDLADHPHGGHGGDGVRVKTDGLCVRTVAEHVAFAERGRNQGQRHRQRQDQGKQFLHENTSFYNIFKAPSRNDSVSLGQPMTRNAIFKPRWYCSTDFFG